MNKKSELLINIAKQVEDKSDIFIVWNTSHWPYYEHMEDIKKECCHYELVNNWEYGLKTKRLWIYVNSPENRLMYIVEVTPHRGDLPENSDCPGCWEGTKIYNSARRGEREFAAGYVGKEKCNSAYKLKLLYKFDKLISLENFKHWKTKKTLNASVLRKGNVYVSSYENLLIDIYTKKIW